MLLGADLGLFLCSLVSVVVGWFVVRRKWRRVVSRRQEIRRLLALALEETARAEYEAVAAYRSYEEEWFIAVSELSSQRQFQHQCEVCFSPTTTRCKSCKAVHYCSGKCQIIHWRQGHKNECASFASHENIDVGLLQEDDLQEAINVKESCPTKPVIRSSGECFSNPSLHMLNRNNGMLNGNNVTEVEYSDDGKEMNENAKVSAHFLPDECLSSTILSDMSIASTSNFDEPNQFDKPSTFSNEEEMKPILSKQSTTINPVTGVTAFALHNQLKSGYIDTGEHSESSTSSCSSAPESDKHSLSEPSTPSSEFWKATTTAFGAKIDASDELSDVNMQNSYSFCFSSSSVSYNHVNALDFGSRTYYPHSVSMP